MVHSYFNKQAIESNQILITVLKDGDGYYLMAEGVSSGKQFVKILTSYKNYFFKLSDINKYQKLAVDQTFSISKEQFDAHTNQNLKLTKELAICLKNLLDEEKKQSAVKRLKKSISNQNLISFNSIPFKKKKRQYLTLSAIEAVREGLDWATMPLLLFWIPISFANLAMMSLIILIIITIVATIGVTGYTVEQQYSSDKNSLKKLLKNSATNPLELPQVQEVTYSKHLFLTAFVTATTLFSFFWVTYDILVALGIITCASMPILPLIAIPICLAVSFVFASLHFYKLNLENQLYEEIYSREIDDALEVSAISPNENIDKSPTPSQKNYVSNNERQSRDSTSPNNLPTNLSPSPS